MTGGDGEIVLVATPIGNLGDLSPRAIETLRRADVLCCEDTRRTRALLTAAGVPAAGRLRSLHAHNEAARVDEVLAEVASGKTVAVVTDAGMPAVSDPGALLVEAAAAAGLRVSVVPGPSAVLAALVVSGLPADRFCVEGFLPRRGSARARRLEAVLSDPRTSVVLESPHRLAATLADLAAGAPGRPVAVCRELTKLHEEVWRGSASEAAAEFCEREVRGEIVLVVGGQPAHGGAAGPADDDVRDAVASRLLAGESVRDAAGAAAKALGISRRRAYEAAVSARRAGPGG